MDGVWTAVYFCHTAQKVDGKLRFLLYFLIFHDECLVST